MRYLCMGFHDEAKWAAMPEAERLALLEASLAYEEELRAAGHCIDSTALKSARLATTLRFGGGQMSVTDGPFAETKEHLGGFLILEASDLNHAIQLMSKTPCMRGGGSIEIRPIQEDVYAELSTANAMAGAS